MQDALAPRQAAELLGIKHRTLAAWRGRGEGPAFYRVGKAIRYDRADVEAWLSARRQPGATLPSASEEA